MRSFLALSLLLLAASQAVAQNADDASIGGKVPDFQFDKIVMNADGFRGGDAFLGAPVLYEFWGFR